MEFLVDFLRVSPILFYTVVFLVGLSVGSFLNVVIHRLPKMLESAWRQECQVVLGQALGHAVEPFNVIWPPSRCPLCGRYIAFYENIPLFSYLFLRGRCRHCRGKIGLRYPLVELMTGLLSVGVVFWLGVSWKTFYALYFVWSLVAISFIDWDKQIIPDDIVFPLLWFGLLMNAFSVITTPQDAIWGVAAGYLSLWGIYWIFKGLTRKEGMGYGDFKLLAAIGGWLGWQMIPLVILVASLLGCVVGVSLILFRGHDKNIPIPFGPYLAIAGLIALLWGNAIVDGYWQYAL